MQRAAEKRNVTADRLSAGKTADGLVDNRLENGCGQIFLCRALIDQRLDIRFCKNTAAGCDGVERLIMLCVFVQSRCVGLQKGCHLVDKRAGAARADTVHTLLHAAAVKINDLCIFTAKLDGNVGLGRVVRERCRYGDNLLHKRNLQVLGKGKSAGTGDHRGNLQYAELFLGFRKKRGKRFLYICVVTLVIRE